MGSLFVGACLVWGGGGAERERAERGERESREREKAEREITNEFLFLLPT